MENPPPADVLSGQWSGEVWATASTEPHRLSLFIGEKHAQPNVRLSLIRATPEPNTGKQAFEFEVLAHRLGHYISIAAKDEADIGINAMLLRHDESTAKLHGIIVFNNVSTDRLEQREIRFKAID